MKINLKRTLLLLISSLFSISLVEGYLRYFGKDRFDIQTQLSARDKRSSSLRLHLEKNAHHDFEFIHQGRRIYRQEVETDEWGRRKTYPNRFSERLVLFFGCSYTFGSGLQQHETLPYLFSQKTKMDSLNYAIPAYGPHGMLRQLEMLPVEEQISSKYSKVDAAYIFYGFQWRRAVGGLAWIAKMGGGHPYYSFDPINKVARYEGSFREARPVIFYLIEFLSLFHITHYLPNILGAEAVEKKDSLLFCGIMNRSYDLLKKKLGSRFGELNIIHPFFEHDLEWNQFLLSTQSCLSSKIKIRQIQIPGTREDWAIDTVLEDHPNVKFNELLSEHLSQLWQEQ